jgi:catechol 2,3-dioxygenase-like lactoylglutathione lyase family enzyme
MVVLSTDDLEDSMAFYTETLGFELKFRDGSHFAALDAAALGLGATQARRGSRAERLRMGPSRGSVAREAT